MISTLIFYTTNRFSVKFLHKLLFGSKKIFFVAILVIFLLQVYTSWRISYPPTQDQLLLLSQLRLGINPLMFWVLKLASLIFVVISIALFVRIVTKSFGESIAILAGVIVLISPTSFAVWNLHPLTSLEISLVMTIIWVTLGFKNTTVLLSGICTAVLVLFFLARNQPFSNIPLLNSLSLSSAQAEITNRLNSEETLPAKIVIPLWIKRIADNKLYFVYRNVADSFVRFGDFESLFFQEVHPLGQKSFVLFFWPEVLFFFIGLFPLSRSSTDTQKTIVLSLLFLAFVDFILLNRPAYQQFFLVLFPLSILIALGARKIATYPFVSLGIATVLSLAILINYWDLTIRTSYWFDNRPLAYQFIYESLNRYNRANFQRIQVTSLVGDPSLYCIYYLNRCPSSQFVFESFNFQVDKPERGTLYAGFVGEFLGPNFPNNFPENWKEVLQGKGFQILGSYQTHDNIANQYGDNVVLATIR